MFGKTITKPIETDTIINDSRGDFERCSSLNFDYSDSDLELMKMS